MAEEDINAALEGTNSNALTVCLFIFMLGIVISNGFVAGILLIRKCLRKIPNLYIVALSFTQLMVGTFVIMSTVIGLHVLEVTSVWCVCAPYIELCSFTSGIFILLGITIDRFRSILYPISYKPSIGGTIITISLLVAGALFYSVRIFVQFTITRWTVESVEVENATTSESDSFCNILTEDESSDFWFRIFDFSMLFILPIISMVYMYTRIGRKLWDKKIVATNSTQRKRKAVILSIACVSSFLICWMPFYLIDIAHDTAEIVGVDIGGLYYNIGRYVTIFLALSNSIANPIIYGFLNKNFQRELWVMKRQYCCKSNKVGTVESSIKTVSTLDDRNQSNDGTTKCSVSHLQDDKEKENNIKIEKENTIDIQNDKERGNDLDDDNEHELQDDRNNENLFDLVQNNKEKAKHLQDEVWKEKTNIEE